jgi:16S rRNA (cytosine967-C5)-methyltransferase
MALEALRLCLDQGRDVQDALHRALAATPGAKPADNALATELTYGYLRYKGRLDALLDTLLAAPKRTSSAMRRILGVAAYEILFLDRIPAYAGVDWAVTLARKRLGRTVGNVTNAVLRNLIRLGDAPFQEDYFRSRAADDAAFLSAWYSCPLRLVRMWLNAYGREQTKSFLQASLALPPHGLRINRRHTQAAALRERSAPSAVASSSWGLALTQWPEFLDAAVEAGQATRQSFAAQAIMGDLNMDDWPEPILDTCAGRGGKTFLLREAGKEVWASDVNTFRLRQLPVEGRRLGLAVPAFYAPGQGPYPLRRAPRTVFVDAPCSGLGVLSRRPDIKWKRTAQDCRQLTMLQREILNGAAGLLPTGGFLVYVTCTLHPVENEEQTAGFLREHAEFSLILQTQTKAESNLGEFFYGVVLQKL